MSKILVMKHEKSSKFCLKKILKQRRLFTEAMKKIRAHINVI